LTPRRVALVIYAACGLAATLSLLVETGQNRMGGLIVVLFCAATWVGVQHLGYAEFGMAGKLVFQVRSEESWTFNFVSKPSNVRSTTHIR